jgi:hypothetical protein
MMSGQEAPAKLGSLETIEKEGDAARVALARKLAHKAFEQPAAISLKQLTRIGTIGLAHFLDELRKLWGQAVRPEHSEGSPGSSGNPALSNPQRSDTQSGGGSSKDKGGAPVLAAVPKVPRPPHETEGWADLCRTGWQPEARGILFGMLTGLVAIAGFALAICWRLF